MNALEKLNAARRQEFGKIRDDVIARRKASPVPTEDNYPMAWLKSKIRHALEAHIGRDDLEFSITAIDRERLGGDLAIRVTTLLKEGGPRTYISEHVPWMIQVLSGREFGGVVADVQAKGIYVNLTLTDRWLLDSLRAVLDLGERFGFNDSRSGNTILVDYSSPNVGKVLHAGHVRSTIIGHVLCNLYEACGALVYRVNHINDYGGFGFPLEGYRRFQEHFPEGMSGNDRLLQLYAIRRMLERAAKAGIGPEEMDEGERELVTRYFPEAASAEDLKTAYAEFTAASDERFQRLEDGEAEEVELWEDMVDWSLTDFRSFYDALDIHVTFTIGESFYIHAGNAVIESCLEDGRAVEFSEEMAAAEVAKLDALVEAEEMNPVERDKNAALVQKDVGAVVIPLPSGERLVVRRSDGRSIYATRDVGAIQARRQIFDPTEMIYVVGQEQRVHFSRLFEAADAVGLAPRDEVGFLHIFFGFYLNANTKKKLSSRESVANVNHLLSSSIEHFYRRSAEGGELSEEELDVASNALAVGSLVFNDLKQNMKGSVDIHTEDLSKTITDFEKSGGAYVVYSACRARSILEKYGEPVPAPADIDEFELNSEEVALILKIHELPERTAEASQQSDPSLLVRYLLDLAGAYNPYYRKAPVLKEGNPNLSRLLLTQAVQQTLSNGLSVCHVTCPPRI